MREGSNTFFFTDRISADDGSLLSDSSFAMERATTNPDEFPASRLNRILRAISPYHLKTLTIITPHTFLATSTSPSIFTFPFPSLSELTLYACIAPSFFDHSPATPSLKLFHIAAFKQLPNDIGSSISKVPPNLTHLRISEVTNRLLYGNLPEVLRDYVPEESSTYSPVIPKPLDDALPSTSPSDTLPRGRLPPRLHNVVIGFAPLYRLSGGNSASRMIAHFQTVEELKRIMPPDEPNSTKGNKLVILDPPPVAEEYERDGVMRERYKLIRTEWEERIPGEEGCWKVA